MTVFSEFLSQLEALVLGSNSGNSGRDIGTAEFQSGIVGGQTRTGTELANSVSQFGIQKPQFKLTSWDFRDENLLNEMFSSAMFRVNVTFQIGYRAAPTVWESERLALEGRIMEESFLVRRVLSNPDSFDENSGLSSGCLEWLSTGPTMYDSNLNVVWVTMSFTGILEAPFVP